MFANTIISALACVMMFLSKPVYSYELLIIGRFFMGIACGTSSLILIPDTSVDALV